MNDLKKSWQKRESRTENIARCKYYLYNRAKTGINIFIFKCTYYQIDLLEMVSWRVQNGLFMQSPGELKMKPKVHLNIFTQFCFKMAILFRYLTICQFHSSYYVAFLTILQLIRLCELYITHELSIYTVLCMYIYMYIIILW